MTTHTRRPRAEYEALYDRKVEERLTHHDLHVETCVPMSTLQYWFRRFKAERSGRDRGVAQSPQAAFLQVAVGDDDHDAVEVVLREGVRLRVRAGFDEDTVRRLVRALGC